jgi:hypothetical protein
MPMQQLTPAQFALLRNIFYQGGTETIPGDWIVDGTISFEKLDEALQNLVATDVRRTTVDITLDSSHDVILIDTTSNAVTVALPLIANKVYEVKFLAGANQAFVDSAALVDGEASVELYVYEGISVACDGVTWSIV